MTSFFFFFESVNNFDQNTLICSLRGQASQKAGVFVGLQAHTGMAQVLCWRGKERHLLSASERKGQGIEVR